MGEVAIHVENLSKQYRLGAISSGTLSHDLNRVWHKIRGKEDPYLILGEENDRTTKGSSEYIWALKDINFEVERGEVFGIIGRNGAGKSTLLKVLSKVTTPTKGHVNINGRIASLLEVGTGFHPELTGRDNIFLNGAILGMTKAEIKSKFDEIVDFSGVERYIDTPVKRYSSGMYVRLAFAVAAHLEPEILIVDEVLAVGDVEFQRKCIGKMKNVSINEGRTVLFVSHNLHAIAGLCKRSLYLRNGMIDSMGETKQILDKYMSDGVKVEIKNVKEPSKKGGERRGNGKVRFDKIMITNVNGEPVNEFFTGETICFKVGCVVNTVVEDEILCSVTFKAPYTGDNITNTEKFRLTELEKKPAGTKMNFTITIPDNQFKPGVFNLYFWLGNYHQGGGYDIVDGTLPPIVIKSSSNNETMAKSVGYIYINSKLESDKENVHI